jgi:hypothetical protein
LNKVEYSPREGIQGLYDNMQEQAGGMAVYPDDYSMLSIFLDKIPASFMTELLNTRGLTPEVNSLSKFVANTLDVEQRKKNETYYRERRTKGVTTGTPRGPRKYTPAEPKKQVRENETKPFGKRPERFVKYNNFNKSYRQNRNTFINTKPRFRTRIRTKFLDKKDDHAPPRSGKHKYQWS